MDKMGPSISTETACVLGTIFLEGTNRTSAPLASETKQVHVPTYRYPGNEVL
jgi:hypothetical protein